MEEIWRDIEGYEGLYQISSLGNVRSLNYGKRGHVRMLRPKLSNRGYLHVLLYRDGKARSVTIHRMVAAAFLPNPENFSYVNHKDENPKNNTIGNLEWCTASYNTRYSADRHPERYKRGGGCGHGAWKYGASKIVQLSDTGEVVRVWNGTTEIIRKTNWRTSSITSCCLGDRKTAYGFKWRFAIE